MTLANREITKNEFFYVLEDNYDEHIECAIPFYRMMHDEMVRLIPTQSKVKRILDLGCGTGKTAAVLLNHFPESSVWAIDLFDEMLKHARKRLMRFEDRVKYVQGDFRQIPLGENFDVCVSALAIHHSTSAEKKDLFARIYESLYPGGRFLMIDWTKFDSPFIQEVSAQFAEEHARTNIKDEKVVSDWRQHWHQKNIPDTVEDMSRWMREIGFRNAEVVMRCYGMALICAEK